jgi:transketolase
MADLLAILYSGILRVDPARPEWPGRDRFILSKGHGAAILYAVLAETGFFPVEQLEEFCLEGSALTGHINHAVPGVEVSTGSLGHGLPMGCGMALAGRSDGADWRAVVLLSDGELDEGSNWEAILFAAHHRLENLVAIVDFNKIQSFGSVKEVLNLDPLPAKWEAFGWGVAEIDGHDHGEIEKHLKAAPFQAGKPSVLIAHTVKGKGISFMENALPWHYRAPDAALLEKALEELN